MQFDEKFTTFQLLTDLVGKVLAVNGVRLPELNGIGQWNVPTVDLVHEFSRRIPARLKELNGPRAAAK